MYPDRWKSKTFQILQGTSHHAAQLMALSSHLQQVRAVLPASINSSQNNSSSPLGHFCWWHSFPRLNYPWTQNANSILFSKGGDPAPQPSAAGWRSQERSVVIICSWGINTCCWVHFAPYVFFSKNRTLTECVLGQWSGKNLCGCLVPYLLELFKKMIQ